MPANDSWLERRIAGRYRVERALGEGGMASVWSIVDESCGRKLALKRLSNPGNAKLVALFEREFHTLASLRHPSIVEAYDYGSDAKGPYYTMELLEGSDMSTLGPAPWIEVCKILREVASGVALLHARRLIHRDLTPRNVWRTPEGRIKLIDFGTMAAFGRPGNVAGTPPFVAPEALRSLDLDQRTDLYALGALGYFLLTGRHAFPARTFASLESTWKEPPRPASRRVAELARSDLPEVPAALDALVSSLLSHDPLGRPTSAAALIDQLTVIASLDAGEPGGALESYLSAPAFAGRARERGTVREAFERASAGEARNIIVESAHGMGRTRLLAEAALEARLAGAVVLQAEPHADLGTHGMAQELALRLLTELPDAARAAAGPYERTLGHLSPALRERLGLRVEQLAAMPQAHGEARMRVQAALREWFLDVAREHLVVIIADDLQAFDEASAAWLASLGRKANEHKLLIMAAVCTDGAALNLSVQALRQSATLVPLAALSLEEALELFRSMFGEVQHLARLVDRIHQRTEGNPGHAIDLAEHLVRDGVIAHADASWVLPQSLDEAALPANRLDAELARLVRLSGNARRLGQVLSIREGLIPLEMCARLAEVDGPELFGGLEELVREGVLVGSADGYRFTRDSLRRVLHGELDDERRVGAHQRLGALLLASPELSELERLKAGVHLLLGGDEQAGSHAVARAGKHYGLVELADLAPAAPVLEVALERLRAMKRPSHELASVLAPLALAGYYADRRYAARYGEEAVEVLQRIVGLELARTLRRFLGRKLGLLAALGWSALGLAVRARDARVPKFSEAMMLLFNCVAALTGVCVVCVDPKAGKRYANVLEPMTALGPNHVATFMYRFCSNLVGTIRDQIGAGRAQWIGMLERLERPHAVRDLPSHVHGLYLAGALYARGVTECWRDDSTALECAERLDKLELKLYAMSADQVRMMYYANRGDFEAFQRYRERVELHAIQRGTAWQVETWTFSGLITVHLRTGDVAGLKDCVEQLKRICADVPSLKSAHARATAAYLVLRGTPGEALQALQSDAERPLELVGWARGEGVLARAYNDRGDYARAQEVCLRTLEHLTHEDLAFTALNLGLQIELARAEAGLGEIAAAKARLRELVEDHLEAANPLTLGALHEALAGIAVLEGDRATQEASVREVERWFRSTRHPALVARCERLVQGLTVATGGTEDRDQPAPRLMTVLHNLRHGGDSTLTGSAAWTLKQLVDLTDVDEGYLFLVGHASPSCVARIGKRDKTADLAGWVRDQLRATRLQTTQDADATLVDAEATAAIDGDATAAIDGSATAASDCDATAVMDPAAAALADRDKALAGADTARVVLDRRYRLFVLMAPSNTQTPIGALVLPLEANLPRSIVQEIALRLSSSVASAASM